MKAPRYLWAFKNISKCGAPKQNGGTRIASAVKQVIMFQRFIVYSVLKYSVHNIQMLRNVQIEELYT